MRASKNVNALQDLQDKVNGILSGEYTIPTALGPNSLSKNSIKSKSITSGNIDVSSLASVQTKTGSLQVDGSLTIAPGGSLQSGKTAYSDIANGGYWIGIDSGVPKIRVGNIGDSAGWTWDGTSLGIKGSVTATSGTIGGFTIGTTDLQDSGGVVGIASAGSVRIWSGNATPSSAPFRVDSSGNLTATAGSIGGWNISSSGIKLGSSSSDRGMDTGSTAFYAGGSPGTAPFRVTSGGALSATSATITGAISATSLSITGTASFSGGSMTLPNGGSITSSTVDLNQGSLSGLTVDGTITLGSGGKIIDADGSYWDQNGIKLTGSGFYGDSITWNVAGVDKGSIFASSSYFYVQAGSTATGLRLSGGTFVDAEISNSGGHFTPRGRIYPSGSILYYIDVGGIISNGVGIGGMLGISSGNTINFVSPGTGGSAGSWPGTNQIGSTNAGWFTIQIAGTAYKVPFFV